MVLDHLWFDVPVHVYTYLLLQVEVDKLHHDVKKTVELTQSLLKRQAEFESSVNEKLLNISNTVNELLFLAPLPQQLPDRDYYDQTAPEVESRPEVPAQDTPANQSHSTVPPGETPNVVEEQTVVSKPLTSSTSLKTPDQHLSDIKTAIIRSKSCSRKNFATNLARELFTPEERCTSNVAGACGKQKLDPEKVYFIKNSLFEHFPLSSTENSHKAWQDCVKAIDSASRNLARRGKENIS